ncbi:MAG: hypothetical protein LN415_08270 [Candidatus Thermoplasmatota archaeon]|nr:hypothetical protein [Candidatus Thermoplasmatota archaeon]
MLPITAIIAVVVVVTVVLAFAIGSFGPLEDTGEDIGEVDPYWWVDTSSVLFNAGDPINQYVAFRLEPRTIGPPADRVYFASGEKVIALRPSTGLMVWYDENNNRACCFEADSLVTAGPVISNYGDVMDRNTVHWILYFGTESGEFYQLREPGWAEMTYSDKSSEIPSGKDVSRTTLDSKITSIAIYSDGDDRRSANERVFVGTEEGNVYAFSAVWKDDGSWFFDATFEEWQGIYPEKRPLPQDEHVMAYSPASNEILFVGGDNGLPIDATDLVETWILDLTGMTWRELDNMSVAPFPRRESAMVYIPSDDSALLYGGKLGRNILDDMWAFDFSTETWIEIDQRFGSSGDRSGHSMAYVNSEDAVYFHGGQHSDLNKTMKLDLSSWTWSSIDTSEDAIARMGTSMVHDPVKDRLIIFGGDSYVETSSSNQTKVYDISSGSWSWIDTPVNLTPRAWTSMAYDNVTNTAILFGGEDEVGERINETWRLNLTDDTWERLVPTSSPSARFGSSMVFTGDSQAFLFGGDDHEPSELWNITATEGPIIMASLPLMSKGSPQSSPSVYSQYGSEEGEFIVFNGGGYLNHVRTEDGTPVWSGDEQDYILPDGTIFVGQNWSTAPIFSLWDGNVASLIYLGTGNGFLHALYPENGGEYEDWTEEEDGRLNEENGLYGIQLTKPGGKRDTGALTVPEPVGGYIYVASDSRVAYKVQRDRVGDSRAGSIKGRLVTYGPVVTQLQFLFGSDTVLFVDTTGRLYSVNQDWKVNYRVYVGSNVTSGISIWKDEQGSGHLHRSVWFGGEDGKLYCYSSI